MQATIAIHTGGYYSDVVKRVSGSWRFKQRVIHNFAFESYVLRCTQLQT